LSDFVVLPEENERMFSKTTRVALAWKSFPLFEFWPGENPLVLQSDIALRSYFNFLVNA
jgi:hypothetical protein